MFGFSAISEINFSMAIVLVSSENAGLVSVVPSATDSVKTHTNKYFFMLVTPSKNY
jgi:hypothetical protein